jgi:hypothetical protein
MFQMLVLASSGWFMKTVIKTHQSTTLAWTSALYISNPRNFIYVSIQE